MYHTPLGAGRVHSARKESTSKIISAPDQALKLIGFLLLAKVTVSHAASGEKIVQTSATQVMIEALAERAELILGSLLGAEDTIRMKHSPSLRLS